MVIITDEKNAEIAKGKENVGKKQEEKPRIYPKYTPEQIITAFFSYKFSTRQDIKNLMLSLNPQIVDENKVKAFNVNDSLVVDVDKGIDDLKGISEKDAPYNADDILALETSDIWSMLTPYRVGSEILSSGNTQRYDRENGKLIPTGTFADCAEIAARHLLNFFLYDANNRRFNLDDIMEYMKTRDPQNIYFANFLKFYASQTPDLANDGAIEMRSLWNTVVGDMNAGNELPNDKIFYIREDGKNELETGYINLMKVFKKLFILELAETPEITESLENKKKWIAESFTLLFGKLNPNRKYDLDLEGLMESGPNNEDISGTMVIAVKDANGDKLYSFDFYTKYHVHSEIKDFKMIKVLPFSDYSQNLIGHNTEIKSGTAEDAIWFMSKNADLHKTKEVTYPLFYQLFNDSLVGNDAKIRFLEKVNGENYMHKDVFMIPAFRVMLKNIIGDLSLDDPATLNNAASALLKMNKNAGVREIIQGLMKTIKMGGDYVPLMTTSDDSSTNVKEVIRMAMEQDNKTLRKDPLRDLIMYQFNYSSTKPNIDTLENIFENLNLDDSQTINNAAPIIMQLMDNNVVKDLVLGAMKKISGKPLRQLEEPALNLIFKVLEDNNSTITSLSLGNIFLDVGGTDKIIIVLARNKTLRSLDLENGYFGEGGADKLARSLATNRTLTTFNVSGNLIDSAWSSQIAEILKTNSILLTFRVGGTKIDSVQAGQIGEALKINSTLSTLRLRGNNIDSVGAEKIADGLKSNSTLKELDLGNNTILNAGAEKILETLDNPNSKLVSLDLSQNSIGDKEEVDWYGGEEYYGDENYYGETEVINPVGLEGSEVAVKIADILKKNNTLTTLNLSQNIITDEMAVRIAKGIAVNSTLTSLNLKDNNIGEEGKLALIQAWGTRDGSKLVL